MDPVRVLGVDHFMGGVEVTDDELLDRIRLGLIRITAAGCDFGKIELVVKGGDVKHVNVSFELLNTERTGENQL